MDDKKYFYAYSVTTLTTPEKFLGIAASKELAEATLLGLFPTMKYYKTFGNVSQYITDNCEILHIFRGILTDYDWTKPDPEYVYVVKTGKAGTPDVVETAACNFEIAYSKARSQNPFMKEKKKWKDGALYADTTKIPTKFISIEKTRFF